MHDLPETKPAAAGRIFQLLARRVSASRLYPSQFRYNLTIGSRPRFVWFRVAKAGTRSIFDVLRQAGVSFAAENAIFRHYRPAAHRNDFKFAFVRDPVERFVSCWRDRVIRRNHFGFPPDAHARMQNLGAFIAHVENLDIELLGRMESFGDDVVEVLSRLGLPAVSVPRRNASGQSGAPVVPTGEERGRIEALYERDIRILGYGRT
jgi:hypothetical protein